MRYLTSMGTLVLMVVFCATIQGAWFTVPPPAGVTTVLDSQDAQFSSYSSPSPSNQEEWLNNYGSNSSIRIKGEECPSLFQFTLSSYKGQQVVAAELHLARSNVDIVSALAASTVNTSWTEAQASYRYKSNSGSVEWTYPHSDLTTATFGNFGTLTSWGFSASNTLRTYSYNGYTWVAMVIDPSLIQAMILDQPGGLAVTDARYHKGAIGGNPTVYSKELNTTAQPRLFIQFAPSTDTTAPVAVGSLAAVPGMDNGTVELSFTAPSDPDDAKAFGYTVRYSTSSNFSAATSVDRWRIPRPKAPGASQKMLIEGLTAGTAYYFFVQAYDAVGNAATPASIQFTLPAAVATPVLANGGLSTPDPVGKNVQAVPGIMRYFAASEVAKINPSSGDLYGGTAGDDYKKANMVWDAGTNTISLLGCRNEMVGAQLILQRLGSTLDNVRVVVSNLTGPGGSTITANPNVELFQMHYVTSGSYKYSEAAIPLFSPFSTTFSIPDANRNVDGTYQSVWMDLYVPQGVNPGEYTGTVTVNATELSSPVTINLKMHVSSLLIPDYPTFLVDLNGYGSPWNFGPNTYNTCLKYFQVVHKHRAVPNTLPYGWNGNPSSTDRCPTLTGAGPTRHASSWALFDAKYGRFFTSNPSTSAFTNANGYYGPGVNTPITHFYTTFNEGWPVAIMDTTYGFDAAGQGPAYWDGLKTAANWATLFPTLPDLYLAFPSGYRQGHMNVISDWLQHAHNNGWTKTAFEIYLNEKYSYNGAHVFWAMEENEAADDFRADGFYHQMWRDGQAASGVTDVPWHFRIDVSDRYGQNWGQLDNRINWWNLGSGAAAWHWPQKKYRQYFLDSDKQEGWMWYGSGATVDDSGMGNTQDFLQRWCQGFNGGLPYWDSYNTNWTTADDGTPCVVYSGASVPGYGAYSGPIMSIRVKQIRQVQQGIELLNMWAGTSNMNRNRVRNSLNAKYGSGTWDYAFTGVDETKLYKLRADLIAQLEPSLLPAAPGIPSPGPGTTVPANTTLSWSGAASGVTFNVYLDTVNPPVAKVASGQAAATFASASLQTATTYYWQILAINSNGSTFGPVWSFTVQAPPAVPSNPSPTDLAVNVPDSKTLSWSGAAFGVTFNVYLDTVNPPMAKVASGQAAATFAPASLQTGMTYYWKVVAINGAGQTPGPVWSFLTAIPGDVNGDGHVDVVDLLFLADAWGSVTGNANYNAACDLNGDGSVDVVDLLILVENWGR